MKKSVSKRFRITKRGKVIRRPMAISHFRAKKNAKAIKHKRKNRGIDFPIKKILNY